MGWRHLAYLGILPALMLIAGCHKTVAWREPDAQLKEAWEQYRIGEFQNALNLFRSLEESQPAGSEYRIQGLYGEGTCWNYRRDGRDEAKAAAAYDAVIQQAPHHDLAAWSALELVRGRYLNPVDDFTDPSGIIGDYERVYKQYPDTQAGTEAYFYECSLQVPLLDRDRAVKLRDEVEKFLSDHPGVAFRGGFDGILADCYNKLGMEDKRLELMTRPLENLAEIDSNPNPFNAGLYWNVAYTAEFESGDFALARKYYRRMLKEYPRDVRIFAVRAALKRMDEVETALREGREIPSGLSGGVLQ